MSLQPILASPKGVRQDPRGPLLLLFLSSLTAKLLAGPSGSMFSYTPSLTTSPAPTLSKPLLFSLLVDYDSLQTGHLSSPLMSTHCIYQMVAGVIPLKHSINLCTAQNSECLSHHLWGKIQTLV
jgi:hypothetical protein